MSEDARRPPAPSGHPGIGHALEFARGPFDFVDRAIEECGDVYRMVLPSAEVYVLARPALLKRVLVDDIDAFRKTDDLRRAFGEGLISTENEQWSRQRELLQPLFHPNRLATADGTMVDATRRRLETWEPGEVRDVELEMQNLTLEILLSTLFGRELHPGEGERLREAAANLNQWFTPTSWLLPEWIPTPARREFKKSRRVLRREVTALLSDADSDAGSNREVADDTLLSKLHEAGQRGKLSRTEIEDQMITMVFAGYETTAAALSFAWYELARNPDVRRAFHEELETVLDGDRPTSDHVDDLEVTNRIVTESLRLYPPLHTIPRRTVRDVTYDDYLIPSDSEVHLSIIAVHRDDRYYDDPLAFRPDRWADDLEERLPECAYLPFGGGRRTCIGRPFARLEAALVLATIGQRWDLEWTKEDSITIEPEITTTTKGGLPMRLRRR